MLCWDESLSVYGSVAMGWVRAMASGNAEAASRLMLGPAGGLPVAKADRAGLLYMLCILAYPGIPA